MSYWLNVRTLCCPNVVLARAVLKRCRWRHCATWIETGPARGAQRSICIQPYDGERRGVIWSGGVRKDRRWTTRVVKGIAVGVIEGNVLDTGATSFPLFFRENGHVHSRLSATPKPRIHHLYAHRYIVTHVSIRSVRYINMVTYTRNYPSKQGHKMSSNAK